MVFIRWRVFNFKHGLSKGKLELKTVMERRVCPKIDNKFWLICENQIHAREAEELLLQICVGSSINCWSSSIVVVVLSCVLLIVVIS